MSRRLKNKFENNIYRSSHPEVFLGKGVLKICSKFAGDYHCQSVVSVKLLCNFIEITLWHGCSTVNLLHIFRTPFLRNTSWWLLLYLEDLIEIPQKFLQYREIIFVITYGIETTYIMICNDI